MEEAQPKKRCVCVFGGGERGACHDYWPVAEKCGWVDAWPELVTSANWSWAMVSVINDLILSQKGEEKGKQCQKHSTPWEGVWVEPGACLPL